MKRFSLAIAITTILCASAALAERTDRSDTVAIGQLKRILFRGNYGEACRSAGPPIFRLISRPLLGEVTTEITDYKVPSGERCENTMQPGLAVWYKAGPKAGTDIFKYTIEYPHEANNRAPSKGPQPVTQTITVK